MKRRWPKGTWMKLTSGAILRAFMDQRGVSNNDVALAAGVGRTFISALVHERRTSCTPQVAQRIELFLGVPEGVIFVPRASAASGQSVTSKRRNRAA